MVIGLIITQTPVFITGLLPCSDNLQNVDFHLKSGCVRMKYPKFYHTCLKKTPFIIQNITPIHLQIVCNEFGWQIRDN